jgi:hypothetical protein
MVSIQMDVSRGDTLFAKGRVIVRDKAIKIGSITSTFAGVESSIAQATSLPQFSEVSWKIHFPDTVPCGTLDGSVVVNYTDTKGNYALSIPVTGAVRGKLSLSNSDLKLGVIEAKQKSKSNIEIVSSTGQPFRILRIQSNSEDVVVSMDNVGASIKHVIAVEVLGPAVSTPRTIEGDIRVSTDLGLGGDAHIPVSAFAVP